VNGSDPLNGAAVVLDCTPCPEIIVDENVFPVVGEVEPCDPNVVLDPPGTVVVEPWVPIVVVVPPPGAVVVVPPPGAVVVVDPPPGAVVVVDPPPGAVVVVPPPGSVVVVVELPPGTVVVVVAPGTVVVVAPGTVVVVAPGTVVVVVVVVEPQSDSCRLAFAEPRTAPSNVHWSVATTVCMPFPTVIGMVSVAVGPLNAKVFVANSELSIVTTSTEVTGTLGNFT
jgi:hypothetical protein